MIPPELILRETSIKIEAVIRTHEACPIKKRSLTRLTPYARALALYPDTTEERNLDNFAWQDV